MNTTSRLTPLSVRALLATGALLLVPALQTGCARNTADLRLTCLENNAAFSQQFDRAYVSKGAEGNTEIVLVNEPSGSARGDASALQPAVRQVMHLKVHWRPQRGTKQGHPSFTNAGVHWYVFGEPVNGAAGTSDVLEYTGAGFVALSETAGGTQVTIRNATVKPVGKYRGSLNDPVGPARMTGTFLAKKSSKRVNALLAEVKHATGGAGEQQASAE